MTNYRTGLATTRVRYCTRVLAKLPRGQHVCYCTHVATTIYHTDDTCARAHVHHVTTDGHAARATRTPETWALRPTCTPYTAARLVTSARAGRYTANLARENPP